MKKLLLTLLLAIVTCVNAGNLKSVYTDGTNFYNVNAGATNSMGLAPSSTNINVSMKQTNSFLYTNGVPVQIVTIPTLNTSNAYKLATNNPSASELITYADMVREFDSHASVTYYGDTNPHPAAVVGWGIFRDDVPTYQWTNEYSLGAGAATHFVGIRVYTQKLDTAVGILANSYSHDVYTWCSVADAGTYYTRMAYVHVTSSVSAVTNFIGSAGSSWTPTTSTQHNESTVLITTNVLLPTGSTNYLAAVRYFVKTAVLPVTFRVLGGAGTPTHLNIQNNPTGGGSGSQTPWLSDIDGANYKLSGAALLSSVTGAVTTLYGKDNAITVQGHNPIGSYPTTPASLTMSIADDGVGRLKVGAVTVLLWGSDAMDNPIFQLHRPLDFNGQSASNAVFTGTCPTVNTTNILLEGGTLDGATVTNTPFVWLLSYGGTVTNDTNNLSWTPDALRAHLITNLKWYAANGGAATGNLFVSTNKVASNWDSAVFSNVTWDGTVISNKVTAIEGDAGVRYSFMAHILTNGFLQIMGVER